MNTWDHVVHAGSPAAPVAGMKCRLCSTTGQTAVLLSNSERKLIKCRACGVSFVDPPRSVAELSEHFSDRYITTERQLQQSFGRSREPVLTRVARRVHRMKRGGRILDVGCAGGFFLNRYFAAGGWDKFGVEPSRYAAAMAESTGIKVFQGSLLSVSLPSEYFDIVTALDVLYYFPQPQQELRAIRAAMKPGGLLVLELALAETQLWRHARGWGRLAGSTRSLLHSGHLYFYNPASIAFLLRETGFQMPELLPLPGIRQRDTLRKALFGAYYLGSRAVWHLSGGSVILGPNFLVLATA